MSDTKAQTSSPAHERIQLGDVPESHPISRFATWLVIVGGVSFGWSAAATAQEPDIDALEKAACEHIVALLEAKLGDQFEPTLFSVDECLAESRAVREGCAAYPEALQCMVDATSYDDAVETCRTICGRAEPPPPDAGAPEPETLRPVCEHMMQLAVQELGKMPDSGVDDCVAAIRAEWQECADGPATVECIGTARTIDEVMNCDRFCTGDEPPELPPVERTQ